MVHYRCMVIIFLQVISVLFGGILAYSKRRYIVAILLSVSFGVYADGYEELKYEKIFVDLGKDTFVAGDTIQFKGSLIDATTGSLLSDYSRYVYIELISPVGIVECRKKLGVTDGKFQGYLPVSSTLSEGIYTLSAHTLFMQNFPSKFFYKTQVKIVSPLFNKYYIESNFENGFISTQLINRSSKKTEDCSKIEISVDGKVLKTTYKNNKIKWKYNKNSDVVKVTFDNYSKYISLPILKDEVNIDIYPEGGCVLPNCLNSIGLKTLDKYGRGISIKGVLVDSTGKKILDVATNNKGYGVFRFMPEENMSYSVLLGDDTFSLPKIKKEGVKISIASSHKEDLFVEILGDLPSNYIFLIENNGQRVLGENVSTSSFKIKRNNLPPGLLCFKLISQDNCVVSQRYVFNRIEELSAESIGQDVGIRLDSIDRFSKNAQQRYSLDAVALCLASDRYNIDGLNWEYPVEIGGMLSGYVKTEWRNKPIKDAIVNIISPSTGSAYEATTDANGFFIIDGLEWPEETAFACMAKDPHGEILSNIIMSDDEFQSIDPLPVYPEYMNDPECFDVSAVCFNTTMLQEVKVVAKPEDDSKSIMFAAMGIKSVDEQVIEERNITTYEEAIRMFPGIYIQNGKILSSRGRNSIIGSGDADVEIWIDGVNWHPSFIDSNGGISNMMDEKRPMQMNIQEATLERVSKKMTGGLLPSDIAKQHYVTSLSTISKLSGSYPFASIKSIDYIPPQSALFLSSSAAYGGGALVITTKSGEGKHTDYKTGIKVFKPLGVQKSKTGDLPLEFLPRAEEQRAR